MKKINDSPDWFNMNLSELVAKSIKLGVIPIIEFKDKNESESHGAEPYVSIMDTTPQMLIEKEIRGFKRFIDKIINKDGFTIESIEQEEKLNSLVVRLNSKVSEYESAIKILNNLTNNEQQQRSKAGRRQRENHF